MPSIMAKPRNQNKPTKQKTQSNKLELPKAEKPPSWAVVRGLLTCKHSFQTQQQQQQQQNEEQKQQQQQMKEKQKKKQKPGVDHEAAAATKQCKKMKCSGSLCSNTKVMHRPETGSPDQVHKKKANSSSSSSNEGSSRSMKAPLNELNGVVSTSSTSLSMSSSSTNTATTASSSFGGGSFRGMPFRRFSGCYECRMVVDPVLGIARDPSLRGSICSCPECGEIFMKAENRELHQAVRHAVSELGAEDTSKNIVEIIFQSSWLKKQTPVCKIDRILKVHNTQKTISRFEEYRDAIKARATKLPKKNPRCVADGNELLRFHCATFHCSLGLNGSSNLCNSIPTCNICNIIKNGFKVVAGDGGILTTATSGKAHDSVAGAEEDGKGGETRSMLVCRVIAGRVKKSMVEGGSLEMVEEYDSVSGGAGVYSNLDELYVFNPKAILPCFVVIYRGF